MFRCNIQLQWLSSVLGIHVKRWFFWWATNKMLKILCSSDRDFIWPDGHFGHILATILIMVMVNVHGLQVSRVSRIDTYLFSTYRVAVTSMLSLLFYKEDSIFIIISQLLISTKVVGCLIMYLSTPTFWGEAQTRLL